MKLPFLIAHSLSARMRRLRIGILSRYWRTVLQAKYGKAGARLTIKPGAFFSLGKGARVEIGSDVTLAEGAAIFVGDGATLRIGDRVFIGRGSVIAANSTMSIGSGTQIAHYTTIIDTNHRHDDAGHGLAEQGGVSSSIEIGAEVWIAAHCVVLKGRKIGDRAVVGAGSIVTRDVAPGSVVAGNPAKPLQ